MIPYFIILTHPDYKRPSFSLTQGVARDREDLNSRILGFMKRDNEYMEDMYLNTNRSKMESFTDYFENYYQDSYMDNDPITISYFLDGKWQSYDIDNLWDRFHQ